jgi:oxygen-dependent protoporphyrinogen oxidase
VSGPTVAVVGAGVSGLAVAYEIRQRAARLDPPPRVLCLEAGERPGGNVRSERHGDFLCEWGPNGFLDNVPATPALVRRLNLADRMLKAEPAAARRFIWRDGKLRRVPEGPLSFATSDILPWAGKLRLLGEPFARARRDGADESVFDFAARRIGSAAAAVMVDAMVSGVYAGDARRLSLPAAFPKMRAMESEHGSLFRALLARMRRRGKGEGGGGPAGPGGTLTSFRDGMQELVDALAAALGDDLRLSWPVAGVAHMGERGLRLLPREGAPLEVDAVVLANPARESARLVAGMDAETSAAMASIPSAPLVVLHLGFQIAALGEQPLGFGFLVPRGQGLRILGSLWSSFIFRERAAADRRLITLMIGGAHDPEAVQMEDRELVAIGRRELQTAMGIQIPPYFTKIFRHPHGIPQYEIGHLERLATIDRRLALYPGLFVSGNSYRGIAINSCVDEAPRIADAVVQFLRNKQRGS